MQRQAIDASNTPSVVVRPYAIVADLPPVIRALLNPAAYPHPVAGVEVVETHISWVLLTGQFAYKIKKPVRLDFVDFSTLELRRRACFDELRLNRRFAPQIYQEVVSITGSPSRPVIAGAVVQDEPIEYAVKMVQFPSAARLDRVLAAGQFQATDCDRLAAAIAKSHARAAVADADMPFGDPDSVAKPVRDTLVTAANQARGGSLESLVSGLVQWAERESARLAPAFRKRKADGRVRECHGDLHSENIVVLDGDAVPFDCLEFRADLRWIDCMSDVAFLCMDLADRGYPRLAHRLLNAYLEPSGDMEGLAVLHYYQVYRAVVRAVVATLQDPAAASAQGRIPDRARAYLRLAEQYSQPRRAALVITHGVSGTGKTTATQELLEQIGAVRLRSDVERRRSDDGTLGPLDAQQPNTSERYVPAARQAVYDELLRKAGLGLAAGYAVIVDATFLRRSNRDAFRTLAASRQATFHVLAFDADPATLRQRIAERQLAGNDASEATLAVLDAQLAERDPPADDERQYVLDVHDGDVRPAIERLTSAVRPAAP